MNKDVVPSNLRLKSTFNAKSLQDFVIFSNTATKSRQIKADWTGNPLFTCKNVTLDLKRMLRITKILLCQIQSARKILLSGTQPIQKKPEH